MSLFDQFNNTLVRNEARAEDYKQPSIPSTGYVSVRIKEEQNIFTKQKMNLNLPTPILHLAVANDWLVILMTNHMIFRLNLKQPDKQSEVMIEKNVQPGYRVSGIFLDPLGAHLLIALTPKSSGYTAELLYLNRHSIKPKLMTKCKDHEITAVAFDFDNSSEQSTGNILLGTNKGLIFEADVSQDGDKLEQKNWKQVFDIGRGENNPITGIQYFRAPTTNNYIVLVSTLDRLYKFHESLRMDERILSLQSIFNSYLNIPEEAKDFEKVSSNLKYSQLEFIYEKRFPTSFGWLTENGIFYGGINQIADSPNFITTKKTIAYPEQQSDYHSASYISKHHSDAPLSFVLTNHHLMLQYSDHVTAISLINHEIIYQEQFLNQYGKLLALIKDPVQGNVYCFSNNSIFRYKIKNEQRNVWKMYLDINEFDLAKKYSEDNPAHHDIVLSRIADDLYDKKRFIESAKVYSQTKKSFEEITLKFLKIGQNVSLILYLKNRLSELNEIMDKTQMTMLVVWLVELYMSEMKRADADTNATQREFEEFLKQPLVKDCTKENRQVIFDLIASHGDVYNLTALTTLHQDFDSVINQHIVQSNFQEALQALKSQKDRDLYYKYCPILMEEIPKETMELLKAQGKALQAVKLLPTILCLDTDIHRQEVVKYLEFAIHSLGCVDQSIQNYLIQLYAKHGFHDNLMTFFETQGKDPTLVHYDVNYALRLCKEYKIKDSCVFLQCLLELWQQAVELALTFNVKLAQQTASQPSAKDLQRKLWLIIAEHEIKGKENVKEALELLKICDLLRIEDLLPFFSDFQKIDHFKEAICDSLKEYNQKIQEQRKDMEDSAKAAENVRDSLQTFRNRSVTIGAQEKCCVCGIFLLLKPFYLFPCSHKFHSECLEKKLVQLLGPQEGQMLLKLKQRLSILNTQIELAANANTVVGAQVVINRDSLKAEIEGIMSDECIYCGDLMIEHLDKGFEDSKDIGGRDW